MPETTSGKWDASTVFRRVTNETFVGDTFTVSWTPSPSATSFTTGSYTGVIFTASSTFTVSAGRRSVEYLIVAGGGAGGQQQGALGAYGGGGAGGVAQGKTGVTPGSYPVVVGAGGNVVVPTPGNGVIGTGGSGTPSSFGPITATGGGGGAAPNQSQSANAPASAHPNGTPGGSGGGGHSSRIVTNPTYPQIIGVSQGGVGTGLEGFAGSPGTVTGLISGPSPVINVYRGGGGGGAGGIFTNVRTLPSVPVLQCGGEGIASSITGAETYYGGGGGGGLCTANPSTFIPGGLGGGGWGGRGTVPGVVAATAGTANTGGGGGGGAGGLGTATSGAGGSGIVILRWIS